MRSLPRLTIVLSLIIILSGILFGIWQWKFSESAYLSDLTDAQKAEYQIWKTSPIGVKASDLDLTPPSDDLLAVVAQFELVWTVSQSFYDQDFTRFNEIYRDGKEPTESDIMMIQSYSPVLTNQAILATHPDYDLNLINLNPETNNKLQTIIKNSFRVRQTSFLINSHFDKTDDTLNDLLIISQLAYLSDYSSSNNILLSAMMLEVVLNEIEIIQYESLSVNQKETYKSILDHAILALDKEVLSLSPMNFDNIGALRNKVIETGDLSLLSNLETMTGKELLETNLGYTNIHSTVLAVLYGPGISGLENTQNSIIDLRNKAKSLLNEI